MIKALSLAAALALLPLSAAVGADQRGPAEDALEAAAEAFEARMEAFGERAEAIAGDETLSEAQRETRLAALWAEYQPDVDAFTRVASVHASTIAAEALADIDIDAVVAEALAGVEVDPEVEGALARAHGIAANGAWASNDPEHMATYGLLADYAVGAALDSVEEAGAAIESATAAEENQAPEPAEDDDEA